MVNYVVYMTVKDVHEGSEAIGVCFDGGKPSYARRSLGWFVSFEHSHESLYFGNERPELNPGDRVKLTFQRLAA